MCGQTSYELLQEDARHFLARAGQLSIAEREANGEGSLISVNEALGMATRVLAEQALELQKLADDEEKNNVVH